ncbi:MAG: hypothetical protein H7301_13245, partial [Cryobacterium sp.]|nr:hypothetical protein [Oligoflexia bacterium]
MTTWKWSGFSFLFLFGFGVGLAGASGSASYDLFLPQNSNYIDFPLSRFKSELGRAAAGLKDYVCDGTAEFQLFQNLAHPNPLADSLKLQNAANGPVFVYRHGTFYDVQGRAIRKPSGLFYGPLVEALAKIEAVPEGHELLELLETSPYPLTLT